MMLKKLYTLNIKTSAHLENIFITEAYLRSPLAHQARKEQVFIIIERKLRFFFLI